ncbi:MAG: alanine racemase [Lachnospiraceae bacterium]|nr:alanine racemase [Lachnospiraceae bacterium]
MINAAIIDCKRLKTNISNIKSSLPNGCRIAAVVKGDAYGHGLTGIAGILDHTEDVSMLVTSSFKEALHIIRAGIGKQILILNDIPTEEILGELKLFPEIIDLILGQVIFSMHSYSDLYDFNKLGRERSSKINVHIRLDPSTGIKGLPGKDFKKALSEIESFDFLNISGVYGHLYSMYVDDPAKQADDAAAFDSLIQMIPGSLRSKMTVHLYSSSLFNHYTENTYDMIRVGVLMYGVYMEPCPDTHTPDVVDIITIKGRVLKTSSLISGQNIDYSGTVENGVKKVALISLGSWDIPFFLTCKDPVIGIRGHLCRVIGSPCMDSCLCDISDFDDIMESDEAVILSDQKGLRFKDWIKRSDLNFGNCQMLFSGMERIEKYYVE